jgi:ribonuclease R
LVAQGEHCSDRERRAEAAERELTKVKLLTHLSTRIGEEMDAVITGVEDFGVFAQGIELPAEGFIHVTSLSDDYYRYDKGAHTLTGNRSGNSFRLGDPIRVMIARVDVDRENCP